MFVDLVFGKTLLESLCSNELAFKGDKESILYVLGVLANDTERYSVTSCTLYSSEEFFELEELEDFGELLTNYAAANVDGALFEISPDKKPLNYDLAIDMARQDDYAGEDSIYIIELYAKAIFKRVVQIRDQEDESYYLVESW
jgi:hypothetical protein